MLICNSSSYSDPDWLKYILPSIGIIVTGFFALLKIKSNSVSAARIEWIVEFRECLSKYLVEYDRSVLTYYNFIKDYISEEENTKKEKDYHESCYKATTLGYQVRLLLDTLNLKQKKLNDQIQSIEKEGEAIFLISDATKVLEAMDQVRKKIPPIVEISQEIINEELKKSRRLLDLD